MGRQRLPDAAEVFDAVRAKGFEPVWKDWSLFMQEANIPA